MKLPSRLGAAIDRRNRQSAFLGLLLVIVLACLCGPTQGTTPSAVPVVAVGATATDSPDSTVIVEDATDEVSNGSTAAPVEPTPTAVYTGPQLQTPKLRLEPPPDVLEHLTWGGIGAGWSPCYETEEVDIPVLAFGLGEPEDTIYSNGEEVHLTQLGDAVLVPFLCLNDLNLANSAVAISPTGARLRPYVSASYVGEFVNSRRNEVRLPLEAFSQPGLWHLVIDAPGQHFELGIEIPRIEVPVFFHDYDWSRLWLGGFDPNERIVVVALEPVIGSLDDALDIQAFDIQADSRGFGLVSNPLYPDMPDFVLVGENEHVSCDRCDSEMSTTFYNAYWGGSSDQQAANSTSIPGANPVISNILFCDAPCSGSAAHQLTVFPEAVKEIYAKWDYAGMRQGMQYTREWFSRGQSWVRYQCTWKGPENGSQEVTLKEPGSLRSGKWEMVITVEGQEVARASVDVAGSFDFWDPAGPQPCPDF